MSKTIIFNLNIIFSRPIPFCVESTWLTHRQWPFSKNRQILTLVGGENYFLIFMMPVLYDEDWRHDLYSVTCCDVKENVYHDFHFTAHNMLQYDICKMLCQYFESPSYFHFIRHTRNSYLKTRHFMQDTDMRGIPPVSSMYYNRITVILMTNSPDNSPICY